MMCVSVCTCVCVCWSVHHSPVHAPVLHTGHEIRGAAGAGSGGAKRERRGTNGRHLFHPAARPPTVSSFDVLLLICLVPAPPSAWNTQFYLLRRGVPPSCAFSLTSRVKTLRSSFFPFFFYNPNFFPPLALSTN